MTPTLRAEIERLRKDLGARVVDQGIELRTQAGEVLLRAGGRWDTLRACHLGPSAAPHVLVVKRSQEKAARQLALWLKQYAEDDPARMGLEMYADRRRGGKTFFVVLVVVLFLLAHPRKRDGEPMIGWIVVPTFSKQREIHETLHKIVPARWLRESWDLRKSERAYRLPTGAMLYIKSGDDSDLLKEGGVPIIGVNEAQEIDGIGIIHCLGNNIDSGGLTLVALNPPNKAIGLWAMNLYERIRSGDLRYARLTEFPPEDNDAIDQSARGRFSELAQVIDPKQEQRDALGMWVAIGDLCYPKFNRGDHVRRLEHFAGWVDITIELNALTFTLTKGDQRPWGIGMDFQGRPWCGAVRAKAYAAPPGGRHKPGTPIYVLHEECTNDVEIGQWWTEEALCREMLQRGWEPREALVIGDGTGASQGATGQQRGREADPATFSFPLVESFGYEIHAPMERTEILRHPRRGSEVVTYRRNPPVEVRLNLVNTLLDEGRLFILDTCGPRPGPGGMTAESFRICEASATKKPIGKGAHLTDAAGYLLYRWETGWRESLGLTPLALA